MELRTLALPPPLPAVVALASELAVPRILLVMQGALGVLATVETVVVMVGFQSLIVPSLVASSTLTAATFWAASRLGTRVWPRRIALGLEAMWLTGATVDLALSIFLTQRGLGAVGTITRIVVPLVVIKLLMAKPIRAAVRSDAS